MSTNQSSFLSKRGAPVDPDDEIVISGISGRFPNSANVDEFAHNLFNEIDMVDDAETRWKHVNPEIPRRLGKTVNLEKFDSSFFSVHQKQAGFMDPQTRCLLEHSYEAVLDAGISPKSIKGSRTGVYIGCCFVESEEAMFYEKSIKDGLGLTGSARAMLANRISFGMDLKGPSFMVDTACSSTTYALDAAFNAIRSNEIDAALVGGTNLLLHPYVTLQFARLGVLSKDGYCRPLDKDAAGYTRSEAISVIYLQRKKHAKRAYANLVYVKTNNDGFKKEGITYPSGATQIKLLDQFYKDINLNPLNVDYVEGHSTGTKVGDPEECHTLDTIYCQGRKGPLLIGAVKSNMGHSEASSAVCSIAKIVLTFEKQQIPATIHYKEPRSDCTALVEGRLKVVDTLQEFHGKMISMNSFGFGGGNGHALFKYCSKEKVNFGVPNDDLPRLVTWSGRTEDAVNHIMNTITEKPLDAEFIGLIHNTQVQTTSSNIYRGYGIFTQKELQNAECINRSIELFNSSKRPVVYVYSGMGSQWIGMGADLMKIPIFANTINKCHDVLAPNGINLKEIICSKDPETFSNILNAFIGINAMQIALTDILKAIGLKPDHIIGHSFGELGCSYADNCTTAEETILSAYSRGMASIETKVIFGSMAAVGLGYKQLKDIAPPEIELACHNSGDSCTISGPAVIVAEFVEKLKKDNYFAKEVACANIPYHSKYIAEMGPNLLKRLQNIIKSPKKRSSKWICSSVLEENWETEQAQLSSAEYHTNNLLNPVLFEEAMSHIPKDALTIEIAPYGLLQAILKRSLSEGIHFSLTQRNSEENMLFLLNSLGKLYENGVDFDASKLYPAISFPVSRGTPMISPLIKWDHKQDFLVYKYDQKIIAEKVYTVNLYDPDYEYIAGHEIDGRILFPATGYLYLAWESLAHQYRFAIEDVNVEFEDIKFLRATTITKTHETDLKVIFQRGTGRFEILDGKNAVVTGTARIANESKLNTIQVPENTASPILYNRDFYKELRLRGYNYKGLFRSVFAARADGLKGRVLWQNNWVAFLDCLLQLQIIANDTRSLVVPTGLRKVVIRPRDHLDYIAAIERNEKILEVQCSVHLNALRCGGIEIRGLEANTIGRRAPPGIPVLETQQFIPYLPTPIMNKPNMARFCVQHVWENFPVVKVVAVEIDANDGKEPIVDLIGDAVGDLPVITSDLTYITTREIEKNNIKLSQEEITTFTENTFIIRSNCLQDKEFLEKIATLFGDNGFVISRESNDIKPIQLGALPKDYQIISVIPTEDEIFALIQYNKVQPEPIVRTIKISSTDNEYSWIKELQDAIKEGPVIAYAQKEGLNGIIGLVNCIRREPNGSNLKCFFIDDFAAPAFDVENPFYRPILSYNFAINVYRNGRWGAFRHLLLEKVNEIAPYTTHCYVDQSIRGDLSTIKWYQGPLKDLGSNEHMIRVQYAALNFRDVMLTTGKLSIDTCGDTRLERQCIFGLEFSGLNNKGDLVMGMAKSGCLATHLLLDDVLIWKLPKGWTLDEAATVPCVYGTVYYTFFIIARIEAGKSILIHAGTGGVGLAAIRTAFAYGLEVFTTVSTEEKKNFLLNEFPQLKPENIGNSRDTSFEDMIITRTNGKGVDYVLNSLAGDKLTASIRCLGHKGKFLEIGKFDMANNNKIGLGDFLRELSFHSILVDNLLKATPERKWQLKTIMDEDLANGTIKPLRRTVFKANELEQAFRYLASGKHMGKVIVQVRDDVNNPESLPISVSPKVFCNPEYSYIIPGGLGGFGLELADWLVMRECRKLVLSSGRGVTKQYQAYRISTWESYGAKVVVDTSDITTREGCEELIRNSMKLGPVGGIFNLAVSLRDAIFENQDPQRFVESFAPKAVATKYLDEISRVLCPELQYFVVFSSVSCGRGNAGQSNYGMANSVMERIMEQRTKLGLPAKAIQWGAVGDVGLVADMQEDKIDMEIGGTLQQRISSCLEELDPLMLSEYPVVASMVVAEKRFARRIGGNIIETIMNVMSIKDAKSVSMETTLSELGMDSLMTVEIQQILEREYDVVVSAQELRSMSLSQLQKCVANKDVKETGAKIKITSDTVPKGVALLLRNLGDDANINKKILKLDSSSNEGVKVLVIPGIEGMAGTLWYEVAKGIKHPVYILQTFDTWRSRSLDEIYNDVIKDVLDLYERDEEFYLVGYSFGAMLTLRLAKFLEGYGKIGKITTIDGSPKFLKRLAVEHLPSNFSEELMQAIILTNTVLLCIPDDDGTALKAIMTESTWDAKLNKFCELYKDKRIYTEDYAKKIMNALVNRLMLTTSIDLSSFAILQRTPLTLVRPSIPSLQDIEDDYGLNRYTANKITINTIEGNHATILENPQLAETINSLY